MNIIKEKVDIDNALEKRIKNILKSENNKLKDFIKTLESNINYFVDLVKHLLKRLLNLGNEKDKDYVVDEATTLYDEEYLYKSDIRDIVENTNREDELLDSKTIIEIEFSLFENYDIILLTNKNFKGENLWHTVIVFDNSAVCYSFAKIRSDCYEKLLSNS